MSRKSELKKRKKEEKQREAELRRAVQRAVRTLKTPDGFREREPSELSDFCKQHCLAIADDDQCKLNATIFQSPTTGTFGVWITRPEPSDEDSAVINFFECECLIPTRLVAEAVDSFVKTPHGRRMAAEFIRHANNSTQCPSKAAST